MSIAANLDMIRQFETLGEPVAAQPYGGGHINETYCATTRQGGCDHHYVLQRINGHVFPEPEKVVENMQRVTAHLWQALERKYPDQDIARRCLQLVPARSGEWFVRDEGGHVWRAYHFVGNAYTLDMVESPAIARQAGYAFGEFIGLLTDLPGPPLHETIPGFHDTPARFKVLQEAIEADPHNRAAEARAEIAFAMSQAADVPVLENLRADGSLPTYITHNDTKVNNVLIDETTGEAICVIDIDTVMPGLALYDFGDLVRTGTNTGLEDEVDLGKISMDIDIFKPLVQGYIEGAGDQLEPLTRELMPFAGKMLTFEVGIRFLTDYLQGDHYFKTHRPGHNLDRCRTQFRLVQSIIEQSAAMARIVASI